MTEIRSIALSAHPTPGACAAGPGELPRSGGRLGEGSTINFGAYARAVVTARSRIGDHLDPSLFADPAFDILLDLLACEEEGRKVNMSSCAYAARVPRTTALRWICLLEQKGYVERVADPADHRTTLVQLTDAARSALWSYLQRIARVPILNHELG